MTWAKVDATTRAAATKQRKQATRADGDYHMIGTQILSWEWTLIPTTTVRGDFGR
jgi:hypothetical protein